MKRARIAVVTAVISALFATGALTATAEDDVPPVPENPTWVNEDGSVDESALPSEVPVVGADGEALTDAAGNPITVDPRDGDPDYEPVIRCARCPEDDVDPPPVDAGDEHTVTTDADGLIDEEVEVADDSPLTP